VNLEQFRDSVQGIKPPDGITSALVALWWDAKGDWSKAHDAVQDDHGPEGAWVHAYLHRKQGDASNAAYWYEEAKRALATSSLEEEWGEIASSLVSCIG
jgi:hypothetical protein